MSLARRQVLTVALFVAGWSLPVSDLAAQAAHEVGRDELLVVETRVGADIASEAMPAVRDANGALFLPLRELCDALRFPITVDTNAQRATGWFLSSDRTFVLDLSAGTAVIAGEVRAFPREQVRNDGSDLYVHARLLTSWFPIRFAFDSPTMVLEITPLETLAFQAAAQRERRRKAHRVDAPLRGAAFEIEEQPYQLFALPSHDVVLQAAYPRFAERGAASITHRNAYGVTGAGDVLFMNGRWHIQGSERDAVESAGLTLSRRDPRSNLLGPLRAREFSVGDVSSPTVPLTMRSTQAAGISVSNFPLTHPSSFGVRTLRGVSDPGWEVEAYHNDTYVGYQRASRSGEYEIAAPVSLGLNEYRLESYGPYGERIVERSAAYIGPGMVGAGDFHYRLYSGLQDRDLIPVSPWQRSLPNYGEPRAAGQFELGLAHNVSVSADVGTLALRTGRTAFLGAGVATYFDRFYGTFRLVGETSGGIASEVAGQTRLLEANLNLRHVQFLTPFVSEEFGARADPLTSRTESRVSRVWRLWGNTSLGTSLSGRYDRHQSGDDDIYVLADVGGSLIWNLGWSHGLQVRGSSETFEELGGRATLRWRSPHFAPKIEASYLTLPTPVIRSYGASASIRISEDVSSQVRVLRDLTPADAIVGTAGLRHRWKLFEWSVDAGYSTLSGFEAGVSLSASIGPDPADGGMMVSSAPRTNHGAVVAHVYRDNDFDGAFSADDEPLSNAILAVNGRRRSSFVTNERGRAVFLEAPVDEFLNVGIVPSTLADPFDAPTARGFSVVPRPGTVAKVAFPVVLTGQIEGTVRRRVDAEQVPQGGVDMELVDASGAVVMATRTAYDGFYLFEFVLPGEYVVRPRDTQVAGLRSRVDEIQVAVSPGGAVVTGQDFELVSTVTPQETNLTRR